MSERLDFDFKCSCGEEGVLSLDAGDRRPFACPAGCGAVWIEWFYRGKWRLKCVVQPVYDQPLEAK